MEKQYLKDLQHSIIIILSLLVLIVLPLISKIEYPIKDRSRVSIKIINEYILFRKVLKTNFLLQEQIVNIMKEL